MYNDAGVNIHLHKIGFGKSDEEIDFNFEVAKALGCVGITTERSEALAKRLAPFADKHKIWVAFHNHTNNYPVMDKPDPILDYGEYIGFNFDVGHYFAGTKGLSPIPVIEKYHDRILSLHLKDRTADGGNLPWGQGKTPIKEILQLMKKEKWTFPADIELEYKIPAGSTCRGRSSQVPPVLQRGAQLVLDCRNKRYSRPAIWMAGAARARRIPAAGCNERATKPAVQRANECVAYFCNQALAGRLDKPLPIADPGPSRTGARVWRAVMTAGGMGKFEMGSRLLPPPP